VVSLYLYFSLYSWSFPQNSWFWIEKVFSLRFDFLVTFFGVIGAISPTSFSYIVCIRPLRLLLLFKLKKRYRDVFETVVIVLPRMLRMALVIILLYYSFGIIGIECFSGLPLRNCCPNTSFGAEFEEGGYYYLNHFNDLLHSYGKRWGVFVSVSIIIFFIV